MGELQAIKGTINADTFAVPMRPDRVWYAQVNYRKSPGQPVQCEDMSLRGSDPVRALAHLRSMIGLRHRDYVVQGYFECIGDIMHRVDPVTGELVFGRCWYPADEAQGRCARQDGHFGPHER